MDIERINRWNRFIDETCAKDISSLSGIQRKAVLCFWYDTEMNSGGYSGYKDVYPDTDADELRSALAEVGGRKFADNYWEAVMIGEDDGWVTTDSDFFMISPSLSDCIEEYIEKNKDEF